MIIIEDTSESTQAEVNSLTQVLDKVTVVSHLDDAPEIPLRSVNKETIHINRHALCKYLNIPFGLSLR